MFDPGAVDVSITECSACHQPIALPLGDGGTTICSYCTAEQRAYSRPAAAQAPGPYRLPPYGNSGKLLPFDVKRPPAGFEDLAIRVAITELERLRSAWVASVAKLESQHEPEDEFQAVWLATTLARIYHTTGDSLRERAVLESANARLSITAYRAIALARLVRAAVSARRLDLADIWLAALEPRTGIAEVDSEVSVSRALVLQRREQPAQVVELLRESDEGTGLVGYARPLGDLVRIDAMEKLGRNGEAYKLYRHGIGVHGAKAMRATAVSYDLAVKTRRRTEAVGALVLTVIAGLILLWWSMAKRV